VAKVTLRKKMKSWECKTEEEEEDTQIAHVSMGTVSWRRSSTCQAIPGFRVRV
jgi:hypothetical protein